MDDIPSSLILNIVVAAGTVATAVFTLMAARGAKSAAEATRRASEATLVNALRREYSSAELKAAIEALHNWESDPSHKRMVTLFRKPPDCFLSEIAEAGTNSAFRLDKEMRMVEEFFMRAYLLIRANYISERDVSVIADGAGLEAFCYVAGPASILSNRFVQDPDKMNKQRALSETKTKGCNRVLSNNTMS